jgi:hypothetical protein
MNSLERYVSAIMCLRGALSERDGAEFGDKRAGMTLVRCGEEARPVTYRTSTLLRIFLRLGRLD